MLPAGYDPAATGPRHPALDGPPVHGQQRLLRVGAWAETTLRSLLGSPTPPPGSRATGCRAGRPRTHRAPGGSLQQTVASLAVHGAGNTTFGPCWSGWGCPRRPAGRGARGKCARSPGRPSRCRASQHRQAVRHAPARPAPTSHIMLQKSPDLDAVSALADRANSAGDHWVEAEACQMVAEIALLEPDLKRAESTARRAISAAQRQPSPRAEPCLEPAGNVAFQSQRGACPAVPHRGADPSSQRSESATLRSRPGSAGLGDLDSVQDLLLQGLALARRRGDLATIAVIMANITKSRPGRTARGRLAWSERALQFVHQRGSDSGATLVWAQFCLQACKVGRFEQAGRSVSDGLSDSGPPSTRAASSSPSASRPGSTQVSGIMQKPADTCRIYRSCKRPRPPCRAG